MKELLVFAITFVLVFNKSTVSETIEFKCPRGWSKIYETCYLFVPYQHTWTEALKYCQRQGAILGEPKGFDITSKLATEARNLGIRKFWIGYNRIDHNADSADIGYRSDGRQTGVEVGVWAPYEPQIDKGDCAYVGPPWDGQDDKNRWYLDNCKQVYPAVCQRTPCPEDTYSCHNGRCVSPSSVCDGMNSCGDDSDEMNCPRLCSYYEQGTSGQVVSPRNGSQNVYLSSMNCQWTIEGSVGSRIQIQFNHFDTETDLDFVELWDGGGTIATSQLITRLSGSTLGQFATYMSSTNWLVVRFVTDGSVEKSGFNFTWSTDFQCTLHKLPGKSLSYEAERRKIILGSRQTVSDCLTDCSRLAECLGVQYNIHQPQDKEKECYMIIEPLIVEDDTCCDVYVKTCPGETTASSIQMIPLLEPTLEATPARQFLHTPLYPLSYPGNIEVTYTVTVPGTRLITFELLSVDLCCSDTILLYDGPDPSSVMLYTVSQLSQPGDIVVSTTNTVYIHMQLLSHWKCRGAIFTYRSGCDMVLTSVTGVIQSPGYGITSYPSVASCSWLISPSVETSIRLVFLDFDLENGMDFLEVYEIRNGTRFQRHSGRGFTGSVIPDMIVTTGSLQLNLTTSAVQSGRGFHATYSSGCPQLSSLNAHLMPTAEAYHAPDVVNMSCVEGYYFIGTHATSKSVVLTCLSSGRWDVSPIPVCERGYCGFPPTIQNGYIVMATGVQGGDRVQYACDAGYQTSDSTVIRCLSNNSWEPEPTCSSPACPDLANNDQYFGVTKVFGDGVSHGSVVKIMCPLNYELIGPQTVECVGGEWKMSLPTCERIPCPEPPARNVYLDPNQDFYVGNTIYLSCHPGYVLAGTTVQTELEFVCGDDIPHCINLDECILSLDECVGATCVNTEGSYSCECLPGYRPVGTSLTQCEDLVDSLYLEKNMIGVLSLDECVGATCVDTEGSYRCECLPGYRPVGTSLTQCKDVNECTENLAFCDHDCTNKPGSYECSCYPGYDLYTTPGFGDLELGSGEDGSKPWHNFHINHSCVLKQCDKSQVLEIDNGQALTSKTMFFTGDQIEYLCNVGYILVNGVGASQIIHCQDGEWTSIPACTEAYCTDVTDPDAEPAGDILYGAKVQKRCTMRNGDVITLERECGYNYFLNQYMTSGDKFVCPETDCGAPPQIKGTVPNSLQCTFFDCSFEFQCKAGYHQQGSSSKGDNTVRCTEDGSWDFGDLTCQGGQCPDPGHPVDGYVTFSSYLHGNDLVYTVEEGSVATFHCNREGYEPTPHNTIECVVFDDGGPGWSDSVPVCRDRADPVFDSCPGTMFVDMYAPIKYEEPKPSDNTAVYMFEVSPENFQPDTVVDAALRVRYRAVDYAGLASHCDIWIYLTDMVPPLVECLRPDIIYAPSLGVKEIITNTSAFVDVIEEDVRIESYPPVMYIGQSMVGINPVVDYKAIDRSGNTAVCRSQLRIEGPQCDESEITFSYENVTCTMVGSRTNCQVNCINGYVFYEDPTLSSISLFCENGAWSREPPICTDTSDPYYRVMYRLTYIPTSQIVAETCNDTYKIQIQNQLVTLINALEGLCQGTPEMTIMQAADPVTVDVQTTIVGFLIRRLIYLQQNRVVVTLALEIRPDGLLDSQYASCASSILGSFFSKETEIQSIENLAGSAVCPGIGIIQSTAVQTNEGFSCLSASKPARRGDNSHTCLACPPGMYHDDEDGTCKTCLPGTFNTAYYQSSCRSCPAGTNSKGVGLKYEIECYNWCALYLQSPSGLTPCTDCPRDTYWVDGPDKARCEPCPYGTNTNGRGGRALEDCLNHCEPGTYSPTGLQPCLSCPLHHYQADFKATKCSPCPSNMVTNTMRAKSQEECLEGQTPVCSSMPCKNMGTCEVKRHQFFCNCPDGYTGKTCETIVAPCDLAPCINGGSCRNIDLTRYHCTCPDGFTGDRCEIDGDQCGESNNCINNGTCIDQNKSFMCTCPSYSGFYGSSCQLPQTPCVKNPCLNGGQCIAMNNFYRLCLCAEGFSGVDCEIDLEDCTPGLCLNGATCIDGPNSFTCQCARGFRGTYCHLRDYDHQCQQGACTGRNCVDNYLKDEKYCQCFPGERYGSNIGDCVAISECSNVNCGSYGECMSYDYGYHYKCKCNPGFADSECTTNVDDCAMRPCQNNATCVDGIDDYSCFCVAQGSGGKNCSDNNDGCLQCVREHTASCVDTLDGYTCQCLEQYTGVNCETRIPSCASFPCQHDGVCSNPVTPDLHACDCRLPWTGAECETEMNNCAADNVCENGGTCYSTSDGFVCKCPSSFIGERCELEYSLCDIANPCIGNSTCTLRNGSPTCQCENGYTGESCETLIWFCPVDHCLNGGQCSVQTDVGVVCDCLDGFTGKRCGVNIDECLDNDCPQNSVCVDGINGYTCQCRDGKIGENCQKDTTTKFDYVISSPMTCIDSLAYTGYQLLDGTAISVSLWVRHSVLGRPGTILSLYGATSRDQTVPNTPYHIKINGTHISMALSTPDTELYNDRLIDGINIQDGFWHHLVVSWEKTTGELTLFVDGEYNTQVSIGRGEELPLFGLLQLGMDRDELAAESSSYFIGRISQLSLYDSKLSDPEVIQLYNLEVPDTPRGSVLDQDQTIMQQYTIDYNSHLRDLKCLRDGQCDVFDAMSLPAVTSCPADLGLVVNRVASPEWDIPEFSETKMKSNFESGETTMTYGIYGISSAGYDPQGNAAVCTFLLYNRRQACKAPISSIDFSPECSSIEGRDGSVCSLDCVSDNYSPSIPIPLYQSCSIYSMWDQSMRMTDYMYPTCAASTKLTYNTTISMQYQTSAACISVAEDLRSDLLEQLQLLNDQHNRDLCQFEHGVDDVRCSQALIAVSCVGDKRADVTIVLPWISDEVNGAPVREILLMALVDDGLFTFNTYAEPVVESIEIIMSPACRYGTQNVNNKCVVCGSGTYFDTTLLRCVRCPVGTYRQVNTDTPLLTQCIKCPGSETTDYTGAVSRENCHISCFVGYFYNPETGSCQECPRGFYQENLGQSYCLPCPVDQNTYSTGAKNRTDCKDVNSFTTLTPLPTSDLPGPGVGAATEDGGLSTGVIVAIVVLCVIAVVAAIILIIICCKDRLPCYAEKSAVAPYTATPWKKVHKYGETNLHHTNYRLSDIKDYKARSLDRIPIYPGNGSPTESVNADMPVNVPIFTEKLDGSITKKQWLMSSNVRSSNYSDVDQMSDSGRPESLRLGSEKRGPGSIADSTKTGSERRGPVLPQGSERRGPGSASGSVSRQMGFSKRKKPGRPPAVLTAIPLPQMLAPMSHRGEVGPLQPTEEYIRPLPAADRPRQQVTPLDYREFLEGRHRQVHPHQSASSTSQQSRSSEKILLDSDEEDFR